MKKLIVILAAAALFAVPAMAQKVNSAALTAKITKSEADANDAKKNAKASTWMALGKAYSDAILAPTKDLFSNLDQTMLTFTMGGQPTGTTEENGFTVLSYPWVKVYLKGKMVKGWTQTKDIQEGMYDKVVAAYTKALELDPNSAAKVKQACDILVNFYAQQGNANIEINNYAVAQQAYINAAQIQQLSCYTAKEPQYWFLAGQLCAFLGAEDGKYFAAGQKYLEKARELGYKDETGNVFYFLFHCYYGQRAADKENLIKAKNALLEGISLFPKNDKILDGLMQLYTAEEGVGDPAEIVALIDKALAEAPDNADLWFGRGRIFFKLKNFDECINCFKKIDELKPNDYDTNFYLGYFHIAKGDEYNREFNSKVESFTSQAEYDAALKNVMNAYVVAVPYLEKAHELKKDNADCLQTLKELCFRVRNEPGMMDKYNKYNAELKALRGQN